METSDDDQKTETIKWERFGQFTEADVHHQYAIALKTPPYRDINIREAVDVYIELYRTNDNETSERRSFQYRPVKSIDQKRMRLHNKADKMGFNEFKQVEKESDVFRTFDDLVADGPYDCPDKVSSECVPKNFDFEAVAKEITKISADAALKTDVKQLSIEKAVLNNHSPDGEKYVLLLFFLCCASLTDFQFNIVASCIGQFIRIILVTCEIFSP